jgi:hypothetical protein
LSRPHNHRPNIGRRGDRRQRAPGGERRYNPPVPVNDEGVPVTTPGAPRPSPVVFVSDESRARYPWLPPRVIAGSVWRGPANERVRVDESGAAVLAAGPRQT